MNIRVSIVLLLVCGFMSFGQDDTSFLDDTSNLSCDELEETIVIQAKLEKEWVEYELNSSLLENIKFYKHEESNYWFALVKFKNNVENDLYCGLSETKEVVTFEFLLDSGNNTDILFNEFISPNKCDCM